METGHGGVGAGEPLTPRGNKRSAITESEELAYVAPKAEEMLARGGADKGPNKSDHEAIARNLLEALGHFGVEARAYARSSRSEVTFDIFVPGASRSS